MFTSAMLLAALGERGAIPAAAAGGLADAHAAAISMSSPVAADRLTPAAAVVPSARSEHAIFFAVVLLGLTMCSLGGVGRAPWKYGWLHPVTVFGSAVGTIMLLLAAAVMLGQVTDQILVFTMLFAMKWVVGL